MSYHKIPHHPYPPPGYPSVPPPPPSSYEGYPPPPYQYPPPPPYEGYQGYFGQSNPPQQVQYQDQSDATCTSFLHGCLAALCCCCMMEECCFCLR